MSWFEEWFNTPYYHILYKDRDFAEAEIFIKNLTEKLQLAPHSKIIDLACGKGRHSVFLNKIGFEVLGVDLSEQSIHHNKNFENSTLSFEVHDMRNQLFPAVSHTKQDAVFNLFTSIGYFDDPEDDRKVFSSVHNVLKEKGIFILDFLSAEYVKSTLLAEETIIKEGIQFVIKKRIEKDHVIKDIFFEDQGKKHHYFERVKLHSQEEIMQLALSSGFDTQEIWGNYQLEEYRGAVSPRCIFFLIKK